MRFVDLLPVLRDELAARKASVRQAGADEFVFATSRGGPPDRHRVRERVVKRAAALASERLVEVGAAPLPHVTPHALRRTYASVLLALGCDPPYVMEQMGHTDPALTLRVYAQVMRRDEGERAALAAIVGRDDWAEAGRNATPARSSLGAPRVAV